jgi:hypothetical protein
MKHHFYGKIIFSSSILLFFLTGCNKIAFFEFSNPYDQYYNENGVEVKVWDNNFLVDISSSQASVDNLPFSIWVRSENEIKEFTILSYSINFEGLDMNITKNENIAQIEISHIDLARIDSKWIDEVEYWWGMNTYEASTDEIKQLMSENITDNEFYKKMKKLKNVYFYVKFNYTTTIEVSAEYTFKYKIRKTILPENLESLFWIMHFLRTGET